ncbi:GNAT family N-acetyltransferase [Ancylomarina sp. YFZ004]
METIRLIDIKHLCFSEAWVLYEDAFPLEERRLINSQAAIMNHPNYHFELIFQIDCFLGILFWWGFDDLRYIEHFATLPAHRGKGYGKEILELFIQRDSRPIVLEVELPENEIEQRRIQFYERIGFHLTDHFYQQPVYNEGDLPLQLLLMSYPKGISAKELTHFIKDYHPIIYGIKSN